MIFYRTINNCSFWHQSLGSYQYNFSLGRNFYSFEIKKNIDLHFEKKNHLRHSVRLWRMDTIHDSNLKKESWNFIIIEPKIKIKFQKKAKINIHAHVNKRWHRFHYISICRNTSIVKMLPKRDLTCWSMIKNFRRTVHTLHIWVRLCFYYIMLRLFHWIFHKSNEDRKFLSTYMYVMCLVEYHTYMQKFHSNCY